MAKSFGEILVDQVLYSCDSSFLIKAIYNEHSVSTVMSGYHISYEGSVQNL